MSAVPLPDAVQIKELLGFLFDGLTVKAATAKLDASAASANFVAVYVTDDGMPRALCACDLSFAANGGAALSMLPPTAAKDAIKAKELTSTMRDNLREVMNICTRLVLKDGSPHLRLQEVFPAKQVPAPAAAITGSKTRVDFEVGLGKYGSGALAVISL
jgi:hypothetical protein